LAFGLVRKLQGTEAKVSGVDIQKNNRAQGSPDGFNNSPFLFLAFSQGQMPNHTGMVPLLAPTPVHTKKSSNISIQFVVYYYYYCYYYYTGDEW
jgi:hypothetical protein